VAIEDSRNGLLAARAAGISAIVTPGVYPHGEHFEEAALVAADLAAVEFETIESLFG
jgi:beta-phosphoglucomutase-like phosphatase (HAD superfamily)